MLKGLSVTKTAAISAKPYRRRRALLATLVAATALVGAEQAVVPAPAGAVMQEGNECSESIWVFLDCEEPNGGGGDGGGSGGSIGNGGNGFGDGGGGNPTGDPIVDDKEPISEVEKERVEEEFQRAAERNAKLKEGNGGIFCGALKEIADVAVTMPDASEIVGDLVGDWRACAQMLGEDRTPNCTAQKKRWTSLSDADDVDRLDLVMAGDDWRVCSAKVAYFEAMEECRQITSLIASLAPDIPDYECGWLQARRNTFWQAERDRLRDKERAKFKRRAPRSRH